MSNIFATVRRGALAVLFVFSAVVLGLGANLAVIFLPLVHHDFLIFILIPPSFTMVVIMGLMVRSQPRGDLFCLFILSVLWVTAGAWAQDIIGYVQCDSLVGQTTQATLGTYSSQSYCYQMKTIEAFSWTNFVLLMISFWVILALTIRMYAQGSHEIWGEDVSDLTWWGDTSNYPNQAYQHYAMMQQQPAQQQQRYGPPVIVQQPGQNVYVQQGPDGLQAYQVPNAPRSAPRR